MEFVQIGIIVMMFSGLILLLTLCDGSREIDRNGKSWKWKRPASHNTFIVLSILMLIVGIIITWGIVK